MSDELKTYIEFLFGGLEGYVYAPVKRPGESWEQKFFRYPQESGQLQDWINTSNLDDNAHVYLSPGVYLREEATKASFKEAQVVWVEFDGQVEIDFRGIPDPSAIVQTSSSTHLHAYWKVPTSRGEVIEDVNKRLTYYFGADLSGHDCTQLLRPPSTLNRKHDLPVRLADFQNTSHRLEDFDSAPSVKSATLETIELGKLEKATDVLGRHSVSNRIIKLVKVDTVPVGSRSSFMSMLAYELAEEGFNHLEIVSLLYHADERLGKFRDRNDRLLRLTQLAELALHKVLVQNQLHVYTLADLFSSKRKLEWILPNNWLHKTGQMILSSAPGVGKTQLTLQLGVSLSLALPFMEMSFENATNHSILYMSLEMEAEGPLAFFLEKQRVNWPEVPQNFHIVDEPTSLTNYENEIDRLKPSVIVIDSLTELMDGLDENPNAAARKAMKWCKKIRRRYNCAIILIHHNRKASEGNKKPKSIHDLAGSFQFAQSSDTVMQLWSDHKGLELSTVKCRYGPDVAFLVERSSSLWFTLKDGQETNSRADQLRRSAQDSLSAQHELHDASSQNAPGNSPGTGRVQGRDEVDASSGPESTEPGTTFHF